MRAVALEEKFVQVSELGTITVPSEYRHSNVLDEFRESHDKAFCSCDEEITDEHFSNVTRKCKGGECFVTTVFQTTDLVKSGHCLTFLSTKHAVLVGAQGLILAYQQNRTGLPTNWQIISLDTMKCLWREDGRKYRLPCLFIDPK